jgi:3-oxoacyl-[acyl-carrier protein] reductase
MTDGTALAGRVALVTGGSGGIGRALVRALAAEGAAVAVGYGASREPAEALAAEIADSGGRAVSLGADLADPDAPAQLAGVAEQALGPVDILVANHGIAARRTWEDVTLAEWDAHVDVNLRAPFLLSQRVLPGMSSAALGGSCSSPRSRR